MTQINPEILKAVEEAVVEGKISCEAAHQLAEKLKVSKEVIGEAANQLKVKISTCQLGCF